MHRDHMIPPRWHTGPFSDRSKRGFIPPTDNLYNLVEDVHVSLAEPGIDASHVNSPVPRQIVDNVCPAEGLIGAVDAVRIKVVERGTIEQPDLGLVDAGHHRADRQIDAPYARKHPGFIRRVKLPVVINDYVVRSEEVGIAEIDMIVGPRPEESP